MKKMLLVLVGMLIVSGAAWAAEPAGTSVDLVVLGTYYSPDNDKIYDDGWGAEAQLRFWVNDMVGLALAGGYSEWNYNEDLDTTDGDEFDLDSDGDVALMPAGASLLLRPINTERVSLVLEGGVRYVFVDSDINDDNDQALPRAPGITLNDIDIDDGFVAVATAQLELHLTDALYLLAAAGYQWDIEKGDINIGDTKIGENELESFIAQAGIGLRF